MSDQGTGRYLFAVARGLDEENLVGVQGLRGAPLEVVEHRELQAVVCAVDLAEFGEAALARNLEDLAWLEEVARAHHDVVCAAGSASTVAPMRLVTILSDDASVRIRLEALHESLTTALDRVQGSHEWSVKVFGVQEPAPAARTDEPVGARTGGAGAAYLRRKKEQAEQRRAADDRAAELAEEIHAELTAVAVASRRLPSQDPRLTGRSDPMLLNGTYLVPTEEREAFEALVRRVSETRPTAVVEVDGPWPPYSFATLE